MDICASELIPPPCACVGAHRSAIGVRVCMCVCTCARARRRNVAREGMWTQGDVAGGRRREAGDDRSLEPRGRDNTF